MSADRDARLLAAKRREAVVEERELRALTDQAWELRETPYLRDACEAILDFWDRRWLRRHERRLEDLALHRSGENGRGV
jgi:hypothetical protein